MNEGQNKKFIQEWSVTISHGGYYQLPHDFTRNIGLLKFSPIEALVIIDILGYGKDRPVAANTIAEDLGISEKSVRNAFRALTKRGYMHRLYGHGTANRFSFPGLKRVIDELAQNRQTRMPDLHTGVRKRGLKYKQKLHTNKETNNKIKKDPDSYAQLMKQRDELIRRKSV